MILKETDTLAGGTAIPKMAEKHGVSAARPRIRYVIQLGTVALVKMADPRRMVDSADADFVISAAPAPAFPSASRLGGTQSAPVRACWRTGA